jgi:hypothetical protein
VLCAFSIVAQLATGSAAAAQTWGGAQLAGYLSLQLKTGSAASRPPVTQSDALAVAGRTDQLHIVGPCAALFQNTGDQYEPWVLVEQRDMVVTIRPVFERYQPGLLPVLEQSGLEDRTVAVEFDRALPQARLVIEDRDGNFYSPWFEVARDRPFRVTAHTAPETGQTRIRVDSGPDHDLYLATSEWDSDWYKVPSRLTFTPASEHGSPRHAVVTSAYGDLPELCARVEGQADLQVAKGS